MGDEIFGEQNHHFGVRGEYLSKHKVCSTVSG